jgi:hypothetical protein
MKKNLIIFSILLITNFIFLSCIQNSHSKNKNETKSTGIQGPYLGQKPPGDIPELFAPCIVADIYDEHSSTAFTPDGKEVFWTRQVRTMIEDKISRFIVTMHMKQENGTWTKPELASFNKDTWTFFQYISKDGKHIYFRSYRPIDENDNAPKNRNWVVEKIGKVWGEPYLFEFPLEFKNDYHLQQKASRGNLYLRRKAPNTGRASALFISKLINGEYQEPELLGKSINSEYMDYAFYIDPDEEFIIFSSDRPGGFRRIDLYISYRQTDDSWSEAINLGEKINSAGIEGSGWPYMSPDGKYLFFLTSVKPVNDIDNNNYTYDDLKKSQLSITNGTNKIHWVSASFIDELKPQHLK